MDLKNIHEVAFIENFITKNKRQRFFSLVNKKDRKKLRLSLAHDIELLKEKTLYIRKEDDSPEKVYQLLLKHGAPMFCHIICEHSKYDNQDVELKVALSDLYNLDIGCIISCIPGKLAYYQGEDISSKALLVD